MFARVLILLHFATAAYAMDCNDAVLRVVAAMPSGGGYSTKLAAHAALDSAVSLNVGRARIDPSRAMPSYCSGAVYLVLLKTLADLEATGDIPLDSATWEALRPRLRPDGTDTLPDGESLWGRWNANGPGAARLVHELKLGRNFTSFSEARPGDFIKMFWSDAVGRRESGHLAVYLGSVTIDGVEQIRFWSSNQPGGFGEKVVPRAKIAWALFSRLENPQNIARWRSLPPRDPWLASLLTVESSRAEALRMAGVKE